MEEKVFIYGDEFGTSHLDVNVKGNISHFIYASIVIKQKDLLKAYEVQSYVSKKYFSGGKIKSNGKAVRDYNFDKRLLILKYIVSNLDFEIHSIIADKTLINSRGLEFKEVFYKYFQRIFVQKIITEHERFEVFAHRVISTEFAKEVYQYLDTRLNTNSLFSNYTMVNDEDEVLVQLADIIVGSLGRVYTTSNYHPRADEILNVLYPKMRAPHFFPYKLESHNQQIKQSTVIDQEIFNLVTTDVIGYIEDTSKEEIKRDLLRILLFMNKVSPFKMIETYELVDRLKSIYKGFTKDQLRLMIRDLRYEGIMVVSALGKSGYKLACNEDDISNYFNHYLKYVKPMLKKIEVADEKITAQRGEEFSLLNQPEFQMLKSLIKVYNQY